MIREEAYQVLSDLIYRGFLFMSMNLDGKVLVFKTVNEREYQLIRLYAGLKSDKEFSVRFNLYFLVFSLFSIDGECVLRDRDQRIRNLFQFFNALPEKTCLAILSKTERMMSNVYEVTKYVEGFSYTDAARVQWKVSNGLSPNDPKLTGIAGTDKLGLNTHQESWIYINRMLDDEVQSNSEFSLAVMIASASNPKGAQQIRAKHDSSVEASESRRKKMAVEGKSGANKKRGWSAEGWAAPVDTAEELLAELDRQMHGVKDRHDIFMENYLKKLRQESDARIQAAKDRIEENRKALGDDIPMFTGEQRVLSPKEMEELFVRSKKDRPSVTKVTSENSVTQQDADRYLDKVAPKSSVSSSSGTLNKVGSRVLTARK